MSNRTLRAAAGGACATSCPAGDAVKIVDRKLVRR